MAPSDRLTQEIERARRLSCPVCGGRSVRPIVYGDPMEEVGAAVRRGEVALGGCLMPPPPWPNLSCAACLHEWYDEEGTL